MKHDQFAGMMPYVHNVRSFGAERGSHAECRVDLECVGSNKTSALDLCVLSAVTFMLLYFCFGFFQRPP